MLNRRKGTGWNRKRRGTDYKEPETSTLLNTVMAIDTVINAATDVTSSFSSDSGFGGFGGGDSGGGGASGSW